MSSETYEMILNELKYALELLKLNYENLGREGALAKTTMEECLMWIERCEQE